MNKSDKFWYNGPTSLCVHCRVQKSLKIKKFGFYYPLLLNVFFSVLFPGQHIDFVNILRILNTLRL